MKPWEWILLGALLGGAIVAVVGVYSTTTRSRERSLTCETSCLLLGEGNSDPVYASDPLQCYCFTKRVITPPVEETP